MVFEPDAHGGVTVVNPPLPARVEAKAFVITVEPESGSAGPTSPLLMLGVAKQFQVSRQTTGDASPPSQVFSWPAGTPATFNLETSPASFPVSLALRKRQRIFPDRVFGGGSPAGDASTRDSSWPARPRRY